MIELKEQPDENSGLPLMEENIHAISERKNNEISSEEENTETPSESKHTKSSSKKKNGLWVKIKNRVDSKLVTSLIITVIATVSGGLLVVNIPIIIAHFRCYSRPYITFESDNTQVFRLSKEVSTFQYSVGESKWEALKTQKIVFGGNHGKLLLRGSSNKGTGEAQVSFASNAEVFCTGDIRTLIDYKHYDNACTDSAQFRALFADCKQLVVGPELTPKMLAANCYRSMFYNCTSLKTAPELPAMDLTDHCYSDMFKGCTSLQRTPELPAVNLSDYCYSGMFSGCTSLKKIPQKLPAKNLADYCYSNMFSGCTSLEYINIYIWATNLKNYCCSNMFKNCTSLKKAPNLLALSLAEGCYSDMFSGCTSLEYAGDILAEKLEKRCYSNMFKNCTSLVKAPILRAENLTYACYKNMFSGCTSLSEITILATEIDAEDCLKGWLENTSPFGTINKNKNATWDNNGIVPPDWKVKYINPEKK